MKSSKLEIALSLAASAFGLIGVFYKPLGLPEPWQWCAFILVWVFLIPLLNLQRRRRTARLAGDPAAARTRPPNSRFWLLLSVVVVGSLSSPLWLPYTGTTLPFSLLVVTSIISCIFSVGVLVFAWRYWWPKG
jgi:hypothetical protein